MIKDLERILQASVFNLMEVLSWNLFAGAERDENHLNILRLFRWNLMVSMISIGTGNKLCCGCFQDATVDFELCSVRINLTIVV
jgi:hypothetical protein